MKSWKNHHGDCIVQMPWSVLCLAFMLGVCGCSAPRAAVPALAREGAEKDVVEFLENLEGATEIRVFLVPQQMYTPLAITKNHMEGASCVYENTTSSGRGALLEILRASIQSVTHREVVGDLGNTRTSIAFFRDERPLVRLFFAEHPDGTLGIFDDGTVRADGLLRSQLEQWIMRPDVERIGLPASARGTLNFGGCPR